MSTTDPSKSDAISPGPSSRQPTSFDGQAVAQVDRVINLLDPEGNILLGTTREQAEDAVRRGDIAAVRQIGGQFAICQQSGKNVRMARSIGRPMRYFIAKQTEGSSWLIIAERMDEIAQWLAQEGLAGSFDPAGTRMVPAHHVLEWQLVGSPATKPSLKRFFAPQRNLLPAEVDTIGAAYIQKLVEVCDQWLETIPAGEPLGVMFSGGIDSGSVLVVMDHLIRQRGQSASRLKAFTLAVRGNPSDSQQAVEFLKAIGREGCLETVEIAPEAISWRDAIKVTEDYKPLDVQSATMGLALLREIRRRYPDWTHLIDGDGGDENLKDYPIEENSELTVQSVLGECMLYQEGWGVDAVKHSQVYSGGQSRGHVRTSAPAAKLGFRGFSPFAVPDVIEVAEAIPFVALTDWDHERLYSLKGRVVASGVRQITGVVMPTFPKRRFQQGAADADSFAKIFPASDQEYRQAWAEMFLP